MMEAIASGAWLTRQRVTAASVMLILVASACIIGLLATRHGTLDLMGRPLGTDFSNVWAAGWMANNGQAPQAWDWAQEYAVQQRTHGAADIPFYGWHYPPPFLLLAALLASLPYLAALALWQATTLAAAVLLARRIVPDRRTALVALGFPVVLVCLTHGHNGFLTASLLGGGMLLLQRRPFVAGLLLGCLIYKPQFALVLPLALLAGGHWRATAGAALSALLLSALTLLIWGWPVWQAFLDSLPLTRAVVIEQGNTGWEKIQSSFAAARMWGAAIPAAYVVQSLTTGLALGGVLLAGRTMAPAVTAVVVLSASLLSTPYVLDYDLVVLAMATAFLVRDGMTRGFLRWEISAIALAWAAPLITRTIAAATGIPLGLIAIVAIFALALRRGILLDGALDAIRSSPFRRSHGASAR